MSVTIKDVAKVAGVSPSTVSRVISDDSSISEPTKKKVRKVMAELKYFPNLNARSLVNKESNVIGLVLPNTTDNFYQNPFFPTVLRGISELASERNYTLLLISGDNNTERLKRVQNMVYGKQVDGLIFLYSRASDEIVSFLIEIDFPFVVIGSPKNPKIHSVDNDNYKMAKQLTNHLIARGATHIAFIGGDVDQHFMQMRYRGYQDAMEEAGMTIDSELIFNDFAFLRSSGYYLAEQLAKNDKLDGVLIADQLVSRGFQNGWDDFANRDLPIVTFKAYHSRDYQQDTEPFMNIRAQELGYTAMDQLLKVIHKDKDLDIQPRIVEAELIE